jgi:hypothetical protein
MRGLPMQRAFECSAIPAVSHTLDISDWHFVCTQQQPGQSILGRSKAMAKKTQKRTLIDTGTDKRYVRRDERGRFKESDDVGRSHSADRRRKAKSTARSGQGDRGDRR